MSNKVAIEIAVPNSRLKSTGPNSGLPLLHVLRTGGVYDVHQPGIAGGGHVPRTGGVYSYVVSVSDNFTLQSQ